MQSTKRQSPSHGPESRTLGHDERGRRSSDANSPDPPAATLHSFNLSDPSRASKRVKRHQDSRTPTTRATGCLKPITTSKEHQRSSTGVGRIPLADLGPMQGPGLLTPKIPKHRQHNTPKINGAKGTPPEIGQPTQKLDSDEESFGEEDIFTSTDQQQLSALRNKQPRHDYDETTTEF